MDEEEDNVEYVEDDKAILEELEEVMGNMVDLDGETGKA